MSLTIQQILLDAKKLASKLKDHDTAADEILSGTELVYKQIDAMKQYTDNINIPTESMTTKSHSALITGLQKESKEFRELQMENQALKLALEDYQNTLEIIMSKYRIQSEKLINVSKIDLSKLYNDNYKQVMQKQAEKISEMLEVMKAASKYDVESVNDNENTIRHLAQLTKENEVLKDLLQISNKYGSSSHKIVLPTNESDLKDNAESSDSTNNVMSSN